MSELELEDCSDLLTGEADRKISIPFAKQPISTLPMIGSESITWQDFERLCCRLVAKTHKLAGCHRYGRGGPKSQGGIDVYGFDASSNLETLVAFQCKKVDDFTVSQLRAAVSVFRSGHLYRSVGQFTIMVSCQLLSRDIADEVITLRRKLMEDHILFDVWGMDRIAEELKPFPEIVEAFFQQNVVEGLRQPWGVRKRILELLERVHVDVCSQELVQIAPLPNSDKEELEKLLARKTVSIIGKHYSFQNAYLHITGFLPDVERYKGSFALMMRQSDLAGCIPTLTHEDVLSLMVPGRTTPVEDGHRPFLAHVFEQEGAPLAAVQLRGVRLFLRQPALHAFADAADHLAESYLQELSRIEREWKAEGFPFIESGASVRVLLGHVPGWVWKAMLDFARRHDFAAGSSDWHVFDGTVGILNVSGRPSGSEQDGCRALIWPEEGLAEPTLSRRVGLLWQPPHPYGDRARVSEQGYWPCSYVFEWLKTRMIPEVLQTVWHKMTPRRFFFRRSIAVKQNMHEWIEENNLWDPRTPNLMRLSFTQKLDTLVIILHHLQRYFSIEKDLPVPITGDTIRKTYKMLSLLAERSELAYWGYVTSNVGIAGPDKKDICRELKERSLNHSVRYASTAYVDHMLRASLELVDAPDIKLTSDDIKECLNCLQPLLSVHDAHMFIKRHSGRLQLCAI